jgi:hypothetical protein
MVLNIIQAVLCVFVPLGLSGAAEPFDKLRTGKDIQCYMGNPRIDKRKEDENEDMAKHCGSLCGGFGSLGYRCSG